MDATIRFALIAFSLFTLPVAAAEWRVAATSADGGGISFVDAASVVRTGDKVTFRLDQRWAKPRTDGSFASVEDVEADCTTRSWTGKSSWREGKVIKKMTLTTTATPGTVYDAVLTAACTGKFRSDAVADRDAHAAAYFAAPKPVPVPESNKFENASAKFSLTKPDTWRFVPREEAKRRAELRVADEEMQKFVDESEPFLEANAVTKLVTIQKPGLKVGSSPTLQVSVRPLEPELPDVSPKNVVEETLRELRKVFTDLVVDSPVREFTFAGHAAADYVATYTLRTKDGRAIPSRNRMIVVVAGRKIFFIAMGHSPGDDQVSKEFESILSTITIGR